MLTIDQKVIKILNLLSSSSANEMDSAINRSLSCIGKICEFDRTYVFLLRDEKYLDNSHEWVHPGILPMINSLQGLPVDLVPHWFEAFAANEIIYISSVDQLPDGYPEKETLMAQDIKSLVVVPMIGDHGLLGFMGYDAVLTERALNEREVFFLRSVAAGITSLILRSQALFVAHAAAKNEQNLARQAIEARHQLDIAINSLSDGFALYNKNGQVVLCNQKFRELSADGVRLFDKEDPSDSELFAFGNGHDQPELKISLPRGHHLRSSSSKANNKGFELQLRDGRWIRITERALPDGGKVSMHIDVTSLKQTEQRLSNVIAGAQVGTWEWDIDSGRCYFNNRWAEMLGYQLSELEPTTFETWLQICHPKDIFAARETLVNVLSGKAQQFEYIVRMRHKSGDYVWVLSRGRVVQASPVGKALVMAGVHIDVTEHKEREQNLVATNLRLQKAVVERDNAKKRFNNVEEASSDWFWEQNSALEFTYISKSYEVRTNAKSDECIGATISQLVQQGLWLDGGVDWVDFEIKLKEQIPFNNLTVEIPITNKKSIWVRLSGVPFHDNDGTFIGYRGVGSDVTSLFNAEAEARTLAIRDPLTGLANRSLLLHRLSQVLSVYTAELRKAAILLIDIDNFKSVNDTMGHDVGDALLKRIASCLLNKLRKRGIAARLSGDRFAILIEARYANDAEKLAAKLVHDLAQVFTLGDETVYITASIGVYPVSESSKTVSACMQNAETALYHAKTTGRCRFVVFDTGLGLEQSRRSEMVQALHRALSKDQFRLVLQPQFVLHPTLSLIGAEVLLRWIDPDFCDISPSTFIEVAESVGLMPDIDLMVIKKSCQMISRFLEKRHQLPIAVNISAQSFQRADFANQLLEQLQKYKIPAHLIQLEITETTLMSRIETTFEQLHLLENEGVHFVIDDFGTGYSSLSYLQQLPIVDLKIDQSFVKLLGCDNHKSESIVSAILSMARELGLRCVAEGVENEAQLAWLQAHECYAVQGFLLSQPIEIADFEAQFLSNEAVHVDSGNTLGR